MANTDNFDYLTNPDYDGVREFIKNKREKGTSWEKMKAMEFTGFFGGFEKWEKFQEENMPRWKPVTKKEMDELIKKAEEAEIEQERLGSRGDCTVLANDNELNVVVEAPKGSGSCWVTYKRGLREAGFSEESVNRLENQVLEILKHISSKRTDKPIKGLVIGNVQSGKTSAMAGVMAMAADYGWNYFIVMTGLTDNLRKQTEVRLRKDLEKPQNRNLIWDYIDYFRMGDRNFNYGYFSDSRRVFFSVILKQKNRLTTEIKFLHNSPNPESIKLLIIDDEADQGSMNTGDTESGVSEEELKKEKKKRSELNKKILQLVNGLNEKGKNPKKFGAMNYVSFTATPYANCLNEFKSEKNRPTLYPEDFICRLEPGRGYFGPEIIFGSTDDSSENTLDIVNIIDDKKDVGMIRAIEKNGYGMIPPSLKDAVAWFLCAAAVFREWEYYRPVSMLVHVNHLTSSHEALYSAINSWLHRESSDSIIERCCRVYQEQTAKLSPTGLQNVYPEYEFLDGVRNYPDFEKLIPHLRDLLAHITSIHVGKEEEDLVYDKGLLICVDNSENNGVDSEGKHMRLVYPDQETLNQLKYAPAFLVIGGNTLSRGLTLEGLVSSYFLRNSIQADSLMQMGRWFGYRKGYELLPRIWMTQNTFEKFQFLVDIDTDLRNQIDQMARLGKKPTDYIVSFLTSPKASWLRLTSNNKMQRSHTVNLDFSGTDMQLVTYQTDSQILGHNNNLITDFMKELGEPERSELNKISGIWRNIPYSTIDKAIFQKGFSVVENSRAFQKMGVLRKWIDEQTKENKFKSWTVILAGRQISDDPKKNYELPGTNFQIGKVNRSGFAGGEGTFTIKALTNKGDYVAHLTENDFQNPVYPEYTWDGMKKEKQISTTYQNYLASAHADQTPLLLIYCVDKNSAPLKKASSGNQIRRPLSELGVQEDFFGLAMVIPGERGKNSMRVKVDENFYSSEGDDTDAD